MSKKFRDFTYSIPWNLGLITLGAILLGFGIKAIAIPHEFFSGGVSGLGLILYYWIGILSPGNWYFLLNLPIFVLGWIFVSRRFILYSLYGMVCMTLAIDMITYKVAINDMMLSALAGGTVIGAGVGITLRSLGSCGGTDIISIILNQKWNFRIGSFNFAFNLCLFLVAMTFMHIDRILYSLTMTFITSIVMEYFLGLFNQRKMALIISEKSREIAEAILYEINRGSTYVYGRGAYTGTRKRIILTIIDGIELKKLEETIFTIDSNAFVIVGNTLNVLGRGFSKRKVY